MTNGQTIHYWHGLDVLAQSDGTNVRTFAYDALGSVRQLADASGVVQLAQTFDPYGNGYSKSGSATTTLGYTGEQEDSSGFVFLRARYYNPAMGRFFQTDPSRQEQNPYQYSLGTPVMLTDPSGLDICIGNAWITPVTNKCWPLWGKFEPPIHAAPNFNGPPSGGSSTPQPPTTGTPTPQPPSATPTCTPSPTETPSPTQTLDPSMEAYWALRNQILADYLKQQYASSGKSVFDSQAMIVGYRFNDLVPPSSPDATLCITHKHCGVDIAPSSQDRADSWNVMVILSGTIRATQGLPTIYVQLPELTLTAPGTNLVFTYTNIIFQYNHVNWSGSWVGSAGNVIGTISMVGEDANMGTVRHLDLNIIDKDVSADGQFIQYHYVNPEYVLGLGQ